MILKAPARFGTPADEGHGRGKGMGYSAGANLRSQRQASFWNDRVRTWLIPTVSFRYVDCKKETEITMPSAPHVISLDSCGEYYLAVDGEIGGRP